MTAKQTVGVRISADEIELLDQYSQAFNKSRSDILSEALARLMQDYRKQYGSPEEIIAKRAI